MAKTKRSGATPNKTAQFPGMTGKGVAPVEIKAIATVIARYERAKEKRCQASPGEITAKRELQEALHKHAADLPLNADGHRFYRQDDVDYILEETLKRRRAGGEEGAGGDFPAMTEAPAGKE